MSPNKASILWVDDDVDLLRPHILFLKQRDYHVEHCHERLDAIDWSLRTPSTCAAG